MFGLVDYQSDDNSEGAPSGKPEQQQASPPSTSVVSQASAIHASHTSLPDAASLFSSPVESRLLPADLLPVQTFYSNFTLKPV